MSTSRAYVAAGVVAHRVGDRTYKLGSGTTSEYGRYVKSLGDPVTGWTDPRDNCPLVSNPDQANADSDAEGDACDADDDNDGVPDEADAFSLDATENADTDSDGVGNNADTDDDGDETPDSDDAFPLHHGEDTDTDADGVGNNTDTDDDGDGIPDIAEATLGTDPVNADSDGDGVDDGQEILAQSDPLDPNSIPVPEPTTALLQLTALLTLLTLRRRHR